MHRLAPDDYPFLLESLGGDGGYDLLFGLPEAWLMVAEGRLIGHGFSPRAGENFFTALDRWQREEARYAVPSPLPFDGGWFLLLGYEAITQIEPRLPLPASPFTLPLALAVRCAAAVVVDRRLGEAWSWADDTTAERRLLADLARPVPPPGPPSPIDAVEEEPPSRFVEGVERILERLRAGDAFQVNLSRRWRARAPGVRAEPLYRRLRMTNPAPFAGLARWRGVSVLSSSPERLLQVVDGEAITRPIAGTFPRSVDPRIDAARRSGLSTDLKERAEHLMLIDLERNDLGRVCVPGSVRVSERMAVESYTHVHHLVSEVRGRLRTGVGAAAALAAMFPGGTITGCPKLKAMEIIAELEGEGRGPYTGAMGYLSRSGRLDTNILIRSMVCLPDEVTFRAGAGIVADSKPASELAETGHKARGLLRALGAE